MNKSWLILIIIGGIFLITTVGWEIFQNVSGNRSNIVITIIDYQRNTLFSPEMRNHMQSKKDFLTQ